MILEFDNDSWISHVKYNTETKEMVITMKGGTKNKYACQNVPREVFEEFKNSPSRGSYFNNNIRGKYNHEWFE